MTKIEIKNLSILFGPEKMRAKRMLVAGKSKQNILKETGCTVAVRNANLKIEEGELFVIMGLSGSGKSTLVNLIPRFYDVTEGSIRIDGKDIRTVTQHELREKIGYVPQKGMLFSGTIASNIAYSDEEMSSERIQEAAKIAQAKQFIEEKPDGYDSPISQGGGNVSGGQKQRLSIARAVAKHPDIFIFDDSFSALDYKTDTVLS